MRCIKYYEGWHDIKSNYPYIGWGHRILPHEKFSKNLTYQQADSCRKSYVGTMHFRLATNPFCNTFGLFCSSRLQPALLGNVFPTFRLPKVLPGIHWRHYFPFVTSGRLFGMRTKTCSALLECIYASFRSHWVRGIIRTCKSKSTIEIMYVRRS